MIEIPFEPIIKIILLVLVGFLHLALAGLIKEEWNIDKTTPLIITGIILSVVWTGILTIFGVIVWV